MSWEKNIVSEYRPILVIEDCDFMTEIIRELIQTKSPWVEIIFVTTKKRALEILDTRLDIKTILLDWDLWNWVEETLDVLRYILETRDLTTHIISISWDKKSRQLHRDLWVLYEVPKEVIVPNLEKVLRAIDLEKIYNTELNVYLFKIESLSINARRVLDNYFWNEHAAITLWLLWRVEEVERVRKILLETPPPVIVELLESLDLLDFTETLKEKLLKILHV